MQILKIGTINILRQWRKTMSDDFPCKYCEHPKIDHTNWTGGCPKCRYVFAKDPTIFTKAQVIAMTSKLEHIYTPDNLTYVEQEAKRRGLI